mmetsp:Transcript_23026/g.27825  ORF Transcript_23026/g.27825 Transcript_23026/m.27825 type:complete len:121 (-) Transcript_23026:408-770(-)
MDDLQEHTKGQFSWRATLTQGGDEWEGLRGRVTAPHVVAEFVSSLGGDQETALQSTHFHLVGNGGMLAELKQGLLLAGVPKERVTTEVYHNYSAVADEGVVQSIADTLVGKPDSACKCCN